MPSTPAPTGAHTTLHYNWEISDSPSSPMEEKLPDFGVGDGTADSVNKTFGGSQSLTQFEGSNNAVDVFSPNSREVSQIIEQHFEGSVSIDFQMTNPWWIQAVLSAADSPTSLASGAYEYTFDGTTPLPMVIHAGYEDRATASSTGPGYKVLSGVVCASASISISVQGVVEVSLNCAYANEKWSQESLDTQPPLEYDVLHYGEAGIDLDGSALSLVQDVSLDIENNTEMIYEVGTRLGVTYSPKGLTPSIDYTQIRQDNTETEDLYGSQGAGSVQSTVDSDSPLTVTTDNGKTGNNANATTFSLEGGFPDTLSTDNFGDPQENLQESINRRLTGISATATVGEAGPAP